MGRPFGNRRWAVGVRRPLLLTAVAVLLLVWAVHATLLWQQPTASEISAHIPPASSVLLDRHGEELYRFFDEEDRVPVTLDAVPDHLIQAVIAIEDREFFRHHGFSLTGIGRALRNNLRHGAVVEGGSTITQQLVKNRVLSPARTLSRKYRELILARRLEQHLSKHQILQMYLNEIPWGGPAHGVEAAARYYFGRTAATLSLSESAFLAGILRAPSSYSPFRTGNTAHLHRRRLVLNRMLDEGFISDAERMQALTEPLQFAARRMAMPAPHFTLYVRKLLEERLGRKALTTQGMTIHSTLNLSLHEQVQAKISNGVKRMFRHRVSNGAALVTDPRNGDILSMVGSVDYFDTAIDGAVNLTLSKRQPGSTIKPLTYAMALEHGRTASSVLSDRPIALTIPDEGDYTPRNDDYLFRGPVTLREALAASRNIPAVNELATLGVPRFIAKARELGIRGWDDQNAYRFALTLGSGEVRMLDLAQLYSVFPNLGIAVAPDPILRITDRHGQLRYQKRCTTSPCDGHRSFEAGTAFLINNILSDETARAPTFGVASDLYLPRHEVAVKTGTTDLLRDNWAVGYTTEFLALVWIGNNDGSPMRFVQSGHYGASTLWNDIMERLLITSPAHRFAVPKDIVIAPPCYDASLPDCTDCRREAEYYRRGTEPSGACPGGDPGAGLASTM